jgi:hypothetical protein
MWQFCAFHPSFAALLCVVLRLLLRAGRFVPSPCCLLLYLRFFLLARNFSSDYNVRWLRLRLGGAMGGGWWTVDQPRRTNARESSGCYGIVLSALRLMMNLAASIKKMIIMIIIAFNIIINRYCFLYSYYSYFSTSLLLLLLLF